MCALFIALEREIPGFDPYVNGHALSASDRRLKRLAKKLEVTPLMDFFSQNPDEIAAFIEGEGGDATEVDLPAETWFDAADGLRTIETLLDDLGARRDSVPEIDRVCLELKEWQNVLKKAAAEGVGWHVEIDY